MRNKYLPSVSLPIKKEWFDMILSGKKLEEYRKISPYYRTRFFDAIAPEIRLSVFAGDIKEFDETLREDPSIIRFIPVYAVFRNGYAKTSPAFLAETWLSIGKGRERWGAEPSEEYYILHIEKIYTEYVTGTGQTDRRAKHSGWLVREREGDFRIFDERTGTTWICGAIKKREDKAKRKEMKRKQPCDSQT